MKMSRLAAIGMIAVLAMADRAAGAQQQPRRSVGWLSASAPAGTAKQLEALQGGLASLGWQEGRDYRLETRYAHGALDRLPALADELARGKVDVLVTSGPATVRAVGAASRVPVVFGFSGDPIVAGLAETFSRPTRNMTGVSFMTVELNAKRIEMLREIMPKLERIAVMGSPTHAGVDDERAVSQATAERLGIRYRFLPVQNAVDLHEAFAALDADPPQAIIAFPDSIVNQLREAIIDFGIRRRIPTISGWRMHAESGALLTYGPNIEDAYRRVSHFVDRILRGAMPAELPIEQPTTFELILNLKTANAIGLTIPEAMLSRADEVIE